MFRNMNYTIRFVVVWLMLFAVGTAVYADDYSARQSARAARYAENSVLKEGTWVKLRVSETGVYKLTYEQLSDMGISPAGVRVFGYGGAVLSENISDTYMDDLPEVGIFKYTGNDGVFGAGDYILFYAQGPVSWTYNKDKKIFEHRRNTYSDYGYYFVTSSREGSQNMPLIENPQATDGGIVSFNDDYYLHEIERTNLINSGKKFFGEEFNKNTPTHSFSISIPDLASTEAVLSLSVAHTTRTSESMAVRLNSKDLESLTLSGTSTSIKATEGNKDYRFTPKGDNLSLQLTYSNTSALAYLNYFTFTVRRNLRKNGRTPLLFRSTEHIGEDKTVTYHVEGTNSETQIWDVTELDNIFRVSAETSGTGTTFTGNTLSLRQYVAVDVKSDNFKTPTVIGRIPNQNLHALGQADMIIITHSDFIKQARQLAAIHSEYDGITTHVVDGEVIFNEFSSGTPDATAYRRFMKMFYDRATTDDMKPKYLLLFGDGSFDNRQLLKANADKNIYRLLTYQSENSYSETGSYTTDDYFAFLDDSNSTVWATNKMDIAVGRLPVYSTANAQEVTDKIIRYIKNEDLGYWKNRAIFIADDGDSNEHIESADSVCDATQRLYPDLLTRKLYIGSYKQEVNASGETVPQMKKEFLDYINSGVLMINYMGHGGHNGWTDEQILTSYDISHMYNERYALWITATCGFARFDDFKDNAGELLLRNANGGAISLITTTRTVNAYQNYRLNREITNFILSKDSNGEIITPAEALRLAKNKRSLSGDANRLSFIYLGDPAMKLNYPKTHKVTIDSINGVSLDEQQASVGALSVVKLKGSVHDILGNTSSPDKTFNGTVHITVFDKTDTIQTIITDSDPVPYRYTYFSNTIFTGETEVTDGEFEIKFIIPKDIKYSLGKGRISMYASDKENRLEGNGYCEDIIIGGEGNDIPIETDGPEITAYLNSPHFINGGRVDRNPLFVARISDSSGINTIGAGIGHDIVLRLDNDAANEIILNNYYRTEIGSFTDGYLNYRLQDLPEGKHTLFFRVWDLQNNSSSIEIDFEVVGKQNITMQDLFVYPNPATDVVNIVIDHDRPLLPAEITLYAYDVAGRMVWTHNERQMADEGNRITVKSDLASILTPGIYVIKALISDNNGGKDYLTTKLVVGKH